MTAPVARPVPDGGPANVYAPRLTRVLDRRVEIAARGASRPVVTLSLERGDLDYGPGQFFEAGVFGAGEIPVSISSPPGLPGALYLTVRAAGLVSTLLTQKQPGDLVSLRGPCGRGFPLAEYAGRDLLFVAGGIGLAPVRSVIWNVLDRRSEFRDVTIVYGARSVGDLVYKRELAEWAARPDVKLWQTVDPGGETPEWKGEIGFVPTIVEKAAPSSANAYAVVCGPPIMIKFTLPVLAQLGFADDAIYTTLENRMKCGLGKCGRCNVGNVYVCKDGPVFTAAQVKAMPQEF